MATTQEIKDANREQLDALLVEAGLDPAAEEHSNVKKAREALLPLATDAEPDTDAEDADEDVEDETDTDPTKADKAPVDDANRVADTASTPKKDEKVVAPVGHPTKFDEYGQPVFGRGK